MATICVIAMFASLFALAGCEGAGGDNINSSEGDGYVNGEETSGVLKAGLVIATAPNDFVGDFYFFDTLTCTATNSCEAEVEGVVTIEFKRTDALFLSKYVKGSDEEQTVTWTDGEWGLAPQGTYFATKEKIEGLTKTWVKDGQILLEWKGTVIGAVHGDSFEWQTEKAKYKGTVSADLSQISYHVTAILTGNEADVILTLVE